MTNEESLREAISTMQRDQGAPGDIPIGELAKVHNVDMDRAWDIYMEEAATFKATGKGKKALVGSSRINIYAGLVLIVIPPLGLYLLGTGIADLAESKGYSRSLGFLALLHVVGLLVVICLPTQGIPEA